MTADAVWKTIKFPATALGLDKDNLIYGIIQDHSFSEGALIIRNTKDETIGKIIYPAGKRKRRMTIGDQIYSIEFPLTINRTALLRKEGEKEILARYVKKSWSGKHEFEIPLHGRLISNHPLLNLKAAFEYTDNGKVVGISQNISNLQNLGRVAILPESLPVEVRSFILSV